MSVYEWEVTRIHSTQRDWLSQVDDEREWEEKKELEHAIKELYGVSKLQMY